ncbi:redoxin domain-containing protein [Demequina sp. NBRC 110053]|uniref:redoxin domain-containing protein n=1 Tax=Demequina sp. NBRC 110053 TaxID=1570342 RepID=UPI0009FE1350|nr:redoxin domain-containing protein [Demequina sp. NBRC 110053]
MRTRLTRIYVEAAGLLTLAAVAASLWLATGPAGWRALAGAIPWLLALGLIGASKALPAARVRRFRRHPWWLYGLSAASASAALTADWRAGAIGAAGLATTLGYTAWFARQHTPSPVVALGAPLPAFPLQTVEGEEVGSAALTHQPHVILFYRGEWCPFCVAQITAIADQYRELSSRGVRVALISNRRAEETEALSRRFDAPMDFYVDAGGAAAQALDIVQSGGTPVTYDGGTGGDTVVPTVIITREDGTVAWLHHADDHRIRPEPSVYLEVIDREGIGSARRHA